MNSKNLAVLLAVTALTLILIGVAICTIWTEDLQLWNVTFTLCGIGIILMIVSLILFYKVEDKTISFKPRFRYTKLLVILPFIFLLSSCSTTTNACNMRNGKNVKIQKTTYSQVSKRIW